jgi:hypothetical protein
MSQMPFNQDIQLEQDGVPLPKMPRGPMMPSPPGQMPGPMQQRPWSPGPVQKMPMPGGLPQGPQMGGSGSPMDLDPNVQGGGFMGPQRPNPGMLRNALLQMMGRGGQ